ncbi:zeta toxin family protein [Streptomyces tendae]|uniref:zeta toxin family protein n=1 Tax=Streptomyces tendae TaxID=1932 RepID=UPI0033A2D109
MRRPPQRRRGDLLIEAALRGVDEFLASALPFAADGYPVELVVLTVRETDSRLSTALRYARALQRGGTGRFTSRSGHDTCFRALTDVAVAEQRPQIAAITVIRRDGQALLRHENGSGTGQASWALAAERLRPYTEQDQSSGVRWLDSERATGSRWRGLVVALRRACTPVADQRGGPFSRETAPCSRRHQGQPRQAEAWSSSTSSPGPLRLAQLSAQDFVIAAPDSSDPAARSARYSSEPATDITKAC